MVGAEDRLLAEDFEVGAMGRLLEVWQSESFAEGWPCRVLAKNLGGNLVGAEGRLLAEDLDVCTGSRCLAEDRLALKVVCWLGILEVAAESSLLAEDLGGWR